MNFKAIVYLPGHMSRSVKFDFLPRRGDYIKSEFYNYESKTDFILKVVVDEVVFSTGENNNGRTLVELRCSLGSPVCGFAPPPAEFSHDEHKRGAMTWVGHEAVDLNE